MKCTESLTDLHGTCRTESAYQAVGDEECDAKNNIDGTEEKEHLSPADCKENVTADSTANGNTWKKYLE